MDNFFFIFIKIYFTLFLLHTISKHFVVNIDFALLNITHKAKLFLNYLIFKFFQKYCEFCGKYFKMYEIKLMYIFYELSIGIQMINSIRNSISKWNIWESSSCLQNVNGFMKSYTNSWLITITISDVIPMSLITFINT